MISRRPPPYTGDPWLDERPYWPKRRRLVGNSIKFVPSSTNLPPTDADGESSTTKEETADVLSHHSRTTEDGERRRKWKGNGKGKGKEKEREYIHDLENDVIIIEDDDDDEVVEVAEAVEVIEAKPPVASKSTTPNRQATPPPLPPSYTSTSRPITFLSTKDDHTGSPPTTCLTCGKQITEDLQSHDRSLSHLLALNPNTVVPPIQYALKERTCPGWRLLENMGWEEGKGLGLSKEGVKIPLKAVLKSDKFGIGKKVVEEDLRDSPVGNSRDLVKTKKGKRDRNKAEKGGPVGKKARIRIARGEDDWRKKALAYMKAD